MSDVLKRLRLLSAAPPCEGGAYDAWLKQADAMEFLDENAKDGEIVIYASLRHTFIHGVLVPSAAVTPPDIDDLMNWNFNPHSSWGVVSSGSTAWIEPPLGDPGSKSIAQGEQLVFGRSFEGVQERRHYIEILQKLVHVFGIHHMPELNAWCRLDRHGDIEHVVRVVEIAPDGDVHGGTVVLFNRDILEEYAALTDAVLVRMFDFTRFRPRQFGGWSNPVGEERRTAGADLFYRFCVEQGHASYSRGVQIVAIATTREAVTENAWKNLQNHEKQYETFIAHDRKNNRIAEIPCSPDALANYFTESPLPFEITPAFFRPEVLSKYKADREKYDFEERSISCRGSWHLQTYDINEAGQVHTYLIYLSHLPYEEQLHWKQYNEKPKAPISKRALTTDIKGNFPRDYNPLGSLKHKLRDLRCPWWTQRTEDVIKRAHYPVTTSNDEWREEILTLDQLLVEGFEEKWLRTKAKELGRLPDAQCRALRLLEECLIGLGFEGDHARSIVTPLRDLHDLRSKLKGHVSGETARVLKTEAIKSHGSYRKHYEHLVTACDEAVQTLIEAFQDSRMN